ncbi:PhnA domain protein [Parashewanella spongiae]|uniref:PhnA domain protein n=1 Tax=Parashewanella spongiae TaxID=342950 RepID=A0A3A6U114_9GAMM|nr:alkylphosphonate utilization protein [Parashewanella spongiae]MCL1076885.1 PhnA domain-containing protein [Parashewanella spongiae]RJY19135.1 PhnA domain protein [Parashewanella spongiae]
MSLPSELLGRCGGKCELCSAETELKQFDIPASDGHIDSDIALCGVCAEQVIKTEDFDVNHMRCLNDSMWSTVPAVQVMSARMLNRLSSETWAQDLKDMLYLDEELQAWVDAEPSNEEDDDIKHVDSNGAVLSSGDTVVIIKDLNVKGTSFVAKRGTSVRNIGLTSNPEHIEGRVNGTRIVILTQYVKKA